MGDIEPALLCGCTKHGRAPQAREIVDEVVWVLNLVGSASRELGVIKNSLSSPAYFHIDSVQLVIAPKSSRNDIVAGRQ